MSQAVIAAIAAACALWAATAGAQGTALSPEQMIEQLKPPAPVPQRPRTRNLVIEQAPPAAEAPVPRPSLSLQIQFAFDSVEVQPESQQALQNLATALQSPQLAGSRFAIEGHTDAKGRRDYNVRLSQRRADAVRDLLARHGVDGARLQTAGKGPDEPADPADPLAPVNRRVRVVNLD